MPAAGKSWLDCSFFGFLQLTEMKILDPTILWPRGKSTQRGSWVCSLLCTAFCFQVASCFLMNLFTDLFHLPTYIVDWKKISKDVKHWMSSPAKHPTFKPIFEESWSARLRCDVCHYIKVFMTEIVLTVAMWCCYKRCLTKNTIKIVTKEKWIFLCSLSVKFVARHFLSVFFLCTAGTCFSSFYECARWV